MLACMALVSAVHTLPAELIAFIRRDGGGLLLHGEVADVDRIACLIGIEFWGDVFTVERRVEKRLRFGQPRRGEQLRLARGICVGCCSSYRPNMLRLAHRFLLW